MKAALLLALLLSPNLFQGDGLRRLGEPPQAVAEIEHQRKILESDETGYSSRAEAIERLAQYDYAEAVSALMKRLECNIAERREQWPELTCTVTPDGLNASFLSPPENYLLVAALSRLKAREALPLFGQMLALDDALRGMSTDELIKHTVSIKRADE